MRPVNLIPADLRRGDHSPLRTGPLAYILLGALGLALVGVVLLVLAGNEISEKKDEIVTLRHEDAIAKARAERLAPYVEFQTMSEQRVQTVTGLANSRFDWPRVMRELALVLPSDVSLESLNASASGAASEGEGGGGAFGTLTGPSLELTGCTSSQDAVAGFITALKDIDGVTRVGLQSSARGEGAGGAEACPGEPTSFQMVVAFDAAPVPVESDTAEAEAATAAPSEEGEEASGEGTEEG
ncbi:MAG TPA: PilN domain-containing protein [Solirubrobacterales bacterium]|nr:PilN domain-containing protein [Solirubrobacterales bacterium]